MRGILAAHTIRNLLIRVQRRVTKVAEKRAVINVGALFRDHVDGSAFGAAVFGREALRTDLEFLDRFQGKLHYRAANCIVFVVNTIDGDIDIAAVFSVHRENRIAVLGRVIRIGGFHTWR